MKIFKQKKGQQIFVGIMVAILCFIALVQMINPLKEQIITARDVTHLDCTNTSISTGQKASCILVDWVLPYFLGVGIAVAIGYISMKKYVQFTQ